MTVDQKVIEIVTRDLVPKEEVYPEHTFSALGADSLDYVGLIIAFEQEFDISITDDEADSITTVQQAIDFIKSKVDAM